MLNAKTLQLVPMIAVWGLAACTNTPDPPAEMCADKLPEAVTRCTAPECSSTTDPKTYQQAELPAGDWIVVSWVASELNDNQNIDVSYGKMAAGGLLARRQQRAKLALRERLSAEDYETLFGQERSDRLRAEHLIRANDDRGPLDLSNVSGTAIQGRGDSLIPPGASRQAMSCTQAAPSCGASALCLIPSGMTAGSCEGMLTIKWRDQNNPGQAQDVAATVRKVGTFGAIVTDDADTVSDADVDALLKRFDEHIAPLDHQFFGEPKDMMGHDRDGNGVAMLFLTSKVASIVPKPVGFFQALDLGTTATSNGADILYMQPPGPSISLDQLSGTLAHEYQHLINYYAKVVNRQSSQETVWLDEGLATFAEDVLGYGEDSLKNIAAYLVLIGDTSLTGDGLLMDPDLADSNARRGMAQLLVRYYFEQKGGAEWGAGPAAVTGPGIAAVKGLVQAPDTGIELFSSAKTGKSFDTWLGDLMTAVAVDGANYPDVSCNPKYSFSDPQVDAYTNFQRGVDLRKSVTAGGKTITLAGPSPIPTFEGESIPIPANGGEVRSLKVTAGTTVISIAGPAEDFKLGLRALPTTAVAAPAGM